MVFVVMPYGEKKDPHSGRTIDFDHIWNEAFRPAIDAAGMDAVRADEETSGGFVHVAMFERLLLAEVVLADLTLASPNVMYELGIRHAARPRATVPVFARTQPLPFDLSPIRAVPYRLERDGTLADGSRAALVHELESRLADALAHHRPDSPLFQVIARYPGVNLPHDVTESFQSRVNALSNLSNKIRSTPARLSQDEALAALSRLQAEVLSEVGTPTELLLDLLLAYRDIEAYDNMVSLWRSFPEPVGRSPSVLQVIAFALNRRGGDGDVEEAIEILEGIVESYGPDPETLGLLGRVHKDRHQSLVGNDQLRAEAALDAAIDAYERGFQADMRDYYPGINAITLLLLKGTEEGYQRARSLSPVVAFAVAGRGGLESTDYWDLATILELSVVNLMRENAAAAMRRLLYVGGLPWQWRTTRENLERLQEAHRQRSLAEPWIGEVVERLRTEEGR
jgi:hypothetical protein